MGKHILILLLIFYNVSLKSQDTNVMFQGEQPLNFKINNGNIEWYKIFDTELNFHNITNTIKESGAFTNIEILGDKIIFDLKPCFPDYKGAGYVRMNSPIFLLNSVLTASVVVEYKENRYRALVQRIVLMQKEAGPFGQQGDVSQLEIYGLKNDRLNFTNYFTKAPNKILDYTFSALLEFKQNLVNEEW